MRFMAMSLQRVPVGWVFASGFFSLICWFGWLSRMDWLSENTRGVLSGKAFGTRDQIRERG
jgi:hypothetical protein